MDDTIRTHVAVIGAGIVGACSALALVRAGYQVTLIEPGEPGGTQAASYGNGAFLSPASIIPMSVPGIWKKVPGYLTDPNGPLTIRWRYLARLAPWLFRFLSSGHSLAKVRRTASILWSLVSDSPDLHAALAASCGRAEIVRRDGLLYAYPDRAAFEQEALSWSLRRENGLAWREIGASELREIEPALSPAYSFGILVESGANCTDPGAYVAAVVAQAVAEGAEFVQAAVDGFELRDGKLVGVRTRGAVISCDRAVIAAGIRSKALAQSLGDAIPLESERGYHVAIEAPGFELRRPVMPSDGKMANVMRPEACAHRARWNLPPSMPSPIGAVPKSFSHICTAPIPRLRIRPRPPVGSAIGRPRRMACRSSARQHAAPRSFMHSGMVTSAFRPRRRRRNSSGA